MGLSAHNEVRMAYSVEEAIGMVTAVDLFSNHGGPGFGAASAGSLHTGVTGGVPTRPVARAV